MYPAPLPPPPPPPQAAALLARLDRLAGGPQVGLASTSRGKRPTDADLDVIRHWLAVPSRRPLALNTLAALGTDTASEMLFHEAERVRGRALPAAEHVALARLHTTAAWEWLTTHHQSYWTDGALVEARAERRGEKRRHERLLFGVGSPD